RDFHVTGVQTCALPISWYSYISPLMTKVAGFSESSMTYILMLAGLGMFFGNLLGGRLADLVSPAKAAIMLLTAMVVALVIQHYEIGRASCRESVEDTVD